MNYFFELSECMTGGETIGYPGRHFAVYDARKSAILGGIKYAGMARASDRIWEENDEGVVRYIKHRFADVPLVKVDMKEFFWIKLKSQTV
jgi:hypothetical protein